MFFAFNLVWFYTSTYSKYLNFHLELYGIPRNRDAKQCIAFAPFDKKEDIIMSIFIWILIFVVTLSVLLNTSIWNESKFKENKMIMIYAFFPWLVLVVEHIYDNQIHWNSAPQYFHTLKTFFFSFVYFERSEVWIIYAP